MSGSQCTFTSGSSTISTFCEDGCCSDGCCSSSSTDTQTLAIIIIAVVCGLILLLLLVLLIWWCLRRQYKDDEKPLTKKKEKDVESGRKKSSGWATANPTPVKQKKKLKTKSAGLGGMADNDKTTQTLNHRAHQGDTLMAPRRKWVGFEGGESYEAYNKREDIREVSTATDGKNTPSKLKGKWRATANVYTRRSSLFDISSSDDESLGPYMDEENPPPTTGDSGTKVVNAYGYAAKGTGKKNKEEDYVLKSDKKKTAVKAWENINPPWQGGTKATIPERPQETKTQKKWKDSVIKVQAKKEEDDATKMEKIVRAMQANKDKTKINPAKPSGALFVKPDTQENKSPTISSKSAEDASNKNSED